MSNITDALPISKKDLMSILNTIIHSGAIMWFDLKEPPEGWEVYTPLLGKYPIGSTSDIGTTVEAGLPDIIGSFPGVGENDGANSPSELLSGAFGYVEGSVGIRVDNNDGGAAHEDLMYSFAASKCDTIYGNSDTVTPPSVRLLPCRKK